MSTPSLAKTTTFAVTAAFAVLLAGPAAVKANDTPAGNDYVQVAVQQLKTPQRETLPPRPTAGPHKLNTQGQRGTLNTSGCDDGAAKQSYEGSCHQYPEYEATGGCQSDTTQSSYPGNCANSSEP